VRQRTKRDGTLSLSFFPLTNEPIKVFLISIDEHEVHRSLWPDESHTATSTWVRSIGELHIEDRRDTADAKLFDIAQPYICLDLRDERRG
jgi:hypothetical protein